MNKTLRDALSAARESRDAADDFLTSAGAALRRGARVLHERWIRRAPGERGTEIVVR